MKATISSRYDQNTLNVQFSSQFTTLEPGSNREDFDCQTFDVNLVLDIFAKLIEDTKFDILANSVLINGFHATKSSSYNRMPVC